MKKSGLESPLQIQQTRSVFHPRAQRNAFRRRDVDENETRTFQSAASSWSYGNGGTKFSKKRTSCAEDTQIQR
jgi:hypothetical protein